MFCDCFEVGARCLICVESRVGSVIHVGRLNRKRHFHLRANETKETLIRLFFLISRVANAFTFVETDCDDSGLFSDFAR